MSRKRHTRHSDKTKIRKIKLTPKEKQQASLVRIEDQIRSGKSDKGKVLTDPEISELKGKQMVLEASLGLQNY